MQAAKFDPKLRVALGVSNDLIASKAKYHLSCYRRFIYKATKVEESAAIGEIAMMLLKKELENM